MIARAVAVYPRRQEVRKLAVRGLDVKGLIDELTHDQVTRACLPSRLLFWLNILSRLLLSICIVIQLSGGYVYYTMHNYLLSPSYDPVDPDFRQTWPFDIGTGHHLDGFCKRVVLQDHHAASN